MFGCRSIHPRPKNVDVQGAGVPLALASGTLNASAQVGKELRNVRAWIHRMRDRLASCVASATTPISRT